MAARSLTAALLLLSVAAACHDSQRNVAPPLDRFYYPTGLAVRHEPPGCAAGTAGCQSQLLVASSNFDLQYEALTGGTLLSVDVDRALDGKVNAVAGPFLPGAVLGAHKVGSFGGEVAVVDETTCDGWQSAPQVLVATRAQSMLYRLDVDPATGALSPAAIGATVQLPSSGLSDTYGVTVVCGNLAAATGGSPKPRHLAFVTFLRARNNEGFLSRIDLDSGTVEATYDVGPGPTQSTAYDPGRGLLFMSERFSAVGVAKLRWLDLGFPQLGVGFVDYGPVVRGAELVSLALSSDSPPSRAYLAARLYDYDTASTTGTRPLGDLGAALLVVDLNRVLSGAAAADTLLNVVHLDRGPAALTVIPRLDASGKPQDLVVVTSSDDGTMTIYDNAIGATAAVFGICDGLSPLALNRQASGGTGGLVPDPCPDGNPSLGKQPFGLAWEPFTSGTQTLARLFVGSFDRSWVNAIVLDPANPGAPMSWARIGPERK